MSKLVSLFALKKEFKDKSALRVSEFALLELKKYLEEKIEKTIDIAISVAKNSGKKTINLKDIEFAIKKTIIKR
ncbi:MAG: hypothetical protein PWP03_779 [Candidatus Woesearchaeota archaeon]|nr:hypothetical protein [Candidatus Woesearchaeota archaeon]